MSITEAIAGNSKEKLKDKDTQKMVSFYNMFLVNLLKFSEHGCFIPTRKIIAKITKCMFELYSLF